MISLLRTSTVLLIAVVASCASRSPAESRSPHRILLQVRAGAGGGNPNRIDMNGSTSIYVDHLMPTEIIEGMKARS